jgi:hypothetical protein
MLPRPEPLPIHAGANLTGFEQTRLADIRRFLGPFDQQVLERTLDQLAHDPHLPADEVNAALKRALSMLGSANGFCDRLATELRSLELTGPIAEAPARVAFAVPTATAHADWLSAAGRDRYPDPKSLASAIRDGEFQADSFDPSAPLCASCRPLFVTDAAEFDKRGPSAAARLCLSGPPSSSYVVAIVPTADLPTPPRVPTTADAVCRHRYTPAPPGARAGTTCSGRPEYVTQPFSVGAVREFRLSR